MEISDFNNSIDVWIDDLPQFSLRQLLAKPDTKSWSLGQVYEHLIEETRWYNGQIEITLGNEQNIEKATSDAAKILFCRGSFEKKRFQGDPFMSEKVKQPTTKDKLKSDLEQLKKDTNDIWKKIENTSKHGKSEHPEFGFLNCFEWIRYSVMHMRHHLRQKKRIIKFLKSIN